MIPAEKNSFKLQPMKLPSASTDRSAKPAVTTVEAWHAKAKAVAERMHTGRDSAQSAKKNLMH
jgi:hypothetical protein